MGSPIGNRVEGTKAGEGYSHFLRQEKSHIWMICEVSY
jgi:hypothetical protein